MFPQDTGQVLSLYTYIHTYIHIVLRVWKKDVIYQQFSQGHEKMDAYILGQRLEFIFP